MYLSTCLSLLTALILMGSTLTTNQPEMKTYKVAEVSPFEVHTQWNGAPWDQIDPLYLRYHMGEKPAHFPNVMAKIAYDPHGIYVIFQVEDRYVKAVRTRHQEGVFKDSCVEFFFSPAGDSKEGYFNLEMNCGGTMLFHHQTEPRKNSVHIADDDLANIKVVTTLPKTVFPEIAKETTWTAAYHIPFEVLQTYQDLTPPTPGTVWRANFYKCADETSHPHWLTWSKIDFPRPNFHLPEFFGTLEF